MLTSLPPQSESVLIQKIYTHFKKAPGTHKLGVLYVVDSVTRKWLEQAKNQGQPVNSSAQDGTYAAGVNRVTELMPVLMNDIIQSAPEEQKVCISDSGSARLRCNRHAHAMIRCAFKAILHMPCPDLENHASPVSKCSYMRNSNSPCLSLYRKRLRNYSTSGKRARHSPRPCLSPSKRS